MYDSLTRQRHPFAYAYRNTKKISENPNNQESRASGWDIYDTKAEFDRMFFNLSSAKSWVVSNINKDYNICETYPKQLILPSSTPERDIREISLFRSKGRLPVLSWINQSNNACLLRSSQPQVSLKIGLFFFSQAKRKTGLSRNRCPEDETFLNQIRTLSHSESLYIYDARPKVNAMANVAAGGGYENIQFYKNTHIEFLNIENIHVIRSSFQKCVSTSLKDPSDIGGNFLLEICHSSWLEYIRLLLEGTVKIIHKLQNGDSVLSHCSDGWDRTAQ